MTRGQALPAVHLSTKRTQTRHTHVQAPIVSSASFSLHLRSSAAAVQSTTSVIFPHFTLMQGIRVSNAFQAQKKKSRRMVNQEPCTLNQKVKDFGAVLHYLGNPQA